MDEHIDALLARKLLGQTSTEEERELREWIGEDPSRAHLVDLVLRGGKPVRAEHGPDVEAAWARVRARVANPSSATAEPAPASARARRSRFGQLRPALLRIAALLVVGAAAVLSVPSWPEPGPEAVAPVLRVVETARGKSRRMVLPDGTKVVLAPASRISYPDVFRGPDRNVRLQGQAYFDVQSDPERPFRIRGGDARVTVIGTAFVVRAYPDEGGVEVMVERGSVALNPDDAASPSGVLLRAGDLGRLEDRSEVPTVVRGGADARYFGWMEGRLVFHDAPVARVLAELSRYYDIDFSAPDAVMRRRVSFTIENQPQAAVLDLLSEVLDLDVRRQDGAVRLEPRTSSR